MTGMALETSDWHEEAMNAIAAEASTGRTFDAFDLQERHKLEQPKHPNHWGSLFRTAAAEGLIRPVGFHQSRRKSRAGGVCRLWVGAEKSARAAA